MVRPLRRYVQQHKRRLLTWEPAQTAQLNKEVRAAPGGAIHGGRAGLGGVPLRILIGSRLWPRLAEKMIAAAQNCRAKEAQISQTKPLKTVPLIGSNCQTHSSGEQP